MSSPEWDLQTDTMGLDSSMLRGLLLARSRERICSLCINIRLQWHNYFRPFPRDGHDHGKNVFSATIVCNLFYRRRYFTFFVDVVVVVVVYLLFIMLLFRVWLKKY